MGKAQCQPTVTHSAGCTANKISELRLTFESIDKGEVTNFDNLPMRVSRKREEVRGSVRI